MTSTLDLQVQNSSDSLIKYIDDSSLIPSYSLRGAAQPEAEKWSISSSIRFARFKYFLKARSIFYPLVKRTIDIVVSLVLLVALLPLFMILALLIKATDGGPVLFWQTRVGLLGKPFRFPKFRSMVPDADKRLNEVLALNQHKEGVTFKLINDPRITRIGRLMRRTSMDELPQLWSVLVGHMTLVGPRPAVPREVALYSLEDRRRLEVVPGLTCIWQVSGRSNIAFTRQLEMDIDYIERRSLALDLKLLALTVPAVLSGRGAY